MSTAKPLPLQWSTQLKVLPSTTTSRLHGDKIILPPSALEQLLAAVTVNVPSEPPLSGHPSTFDPFNPYSYAAERQARAQTYETQQQLPHPLTFRIVNADNGNVVYAGVREFSAKEDHIGLSQFLREALGLPAQDSLKDATIHQEGDDTTKLTVHAQELPKGTSVRFRPLEAGYDVEDWKALLERHMRDTFTTLTIGEVLTIPNGKEEYRFLIDRVVPEGDGICIVDTDLEVDIEALNEEQARETLKRRVEKTQHAAGNKDASSAGGVIIIGKGEDGQVLSGEYVDYSLKDWDRSAGFQVDLNGTGTDGFVDLFVSPYSAKQRAKPRDNTHVFSNMTERPVKRLRIEPSNIELDGAEALWISIRGYTGLEGNGKTKATSEKSLFQYSLRVSTNDQRGFEAANGSSKLEETNSNPDEIQCKNCRQWVPQRTMMLHENFCYRNNVLCPRCKDVFKKSSIEWLNHWHCDHDDSHGNQPSLHHKHDDLFHTEQVCTSCGFAANNIPDLARHRTTTCPGKLILCQFCHLIVPQQGPDDPSPMDAEVIFSGLTPHEMADGARTTECHLCSKITRLRDMSTHLKHHDLERLSRITPRLCRNANCGRTLDGVGLNGEIRRPRASGNDIGLCETCYGPLYNSSFDPEAKALKRRVERKYLTQLLTGCGKDWCRNEYCKTGRKYLGVERPGNPVASREATGMIKPILEHIVDGRDSLHLCTDEASQKRRALADMVATEGYGDNDGAGYDLPWCVAALEAEAGDLDKGRTWLKNWAPTRIETSR
ncbi:hypothetical protein MMC19_004059 [Ptychographa xylographoides]|nr:hypothetical protein [Ptychographa xylographoides]